MARGKDAARREAEQEIARRRHSAAHRSLRKRAQRGKGAHAAAPLGTADAPPTSAPAAPEPHVERVPTSELRTPDWLTETPPEAASTEPEAASTEPEDAADALPEWARDERPAYVPEVMAASTAEEPVHEPSPGTADEAETEPSHDDGDVAAALGAGAGIAGASAAAVTAGPEPEPKAPSEETRVLDPVEAGDTQVMAPVAQTPPQPSTPAPSAPEPAPAPVTTASAAVADEPAHDSDVEDATAHGGAPPRKRRRALAVVPLVIVALAILYVGAQALLSGTVPRDTQTMGVAIGGMSTAEATGAVEGRAEEASTADLVLEAGNQSYITTAQAAGLSIDSEATVAQVTGFTVMPQRLWMHLTGGGSIEPVTALDEPELDAAVAEAATVVNGPATDATVALDGQSIEVVPGRPSITVDEESSAELIAAAWPDAQTVVLVAQLQEPAITDEDAQAFADTLSAQVLAGPITLTGEDAEATIDVETIAAHATVAAGPSGLELEIDGEALATQMVADNPALKTDGENATVSFDENHEIVTDPGTPGITIDGAALGDTVEAAAASPTRSAELPYTAADPEISAEDLGIDDFTEIVASFDTPLTAEPVRTQNLRTAAADVEGTILQPGDQFDLTEVLSPITREEGYAEAHVIVNGILTNGMGGGLSQMATTVYNAAYFAGYELIDHRPHSVWFTRYPAGRESTIYTGVINVVFANSTPHSAIVNSYIDNGRLHVDIWSTPHFTVETSASPKTNITQPGVKEVKAASCEAKGPGQPGFTITNTRRVLLDDELVEETSDTWTYQPDDAIRCVSEDDEDDEDS
ncbi:VanW family protein [Demequina activiva]|uniref:YoaR-like putative peptidoglycan binding domain-containing protein n=1 Tax=Demequina activiva TaxID=1582364 RepID=A0A919Q358_9MICO|nr:VanW family protein [Demequina activiva]GIG53573.1 hypothetical protein Dac01nite_03250 [Demequina activiva]